MKIFVSIVSHFDHDIIINLGTLKRLFGFDNVQVVCRDNKSVNKLKVYCEKYNAVYLFNKAEQGFSANNNANFVYCQEQLGMQDEDYFLILNPDVFINVISINSLISRLQSDQVTLATGNLYLDREYMVHDDNIRTYPKFSNFVRTYLLNDRTTMVTRDEGFAMAESHWASCSFLIVKSRIYKELHGLDEAYYMYCEDIDFCARAKMAEHEIEYLENIKAVHYRSCDSKRFLSKYFFWHVYSVFRYSFITRKVQARKSILSTACLNNSKLSGDTLSDKQVVARRD